MSNIITIHGVRGFIGKDNIAYLNMEDVARGLGFTEIKDNKEYVKWTRVRKYLGDIGFDTSVEKLYQFIPENAFYRLAMKGENETAVKFQKKVADEILPAIRKTGGYVANGNLFVETLFPFADETTKEMMKNTFAQIQAQNEIIAKQKKELEYKENVIIGLVDEVTLAEKRQVLNRVVRYKNANYQERWRELYRQFEMKYHMDLTARFERYNSDHKPKLQNKLDYIDKVMGKIPELYEIACKLYAGDIKELVKEIYELREKEYERGVF
jgi:prophage antirepressor-like protein